MSDAWSFGLLATALIVVSALMLAAACRRENTRINEGLNKILGEKP